MNKPNSVYDNNKIYTAFGAFSVSRKTAFPAMIAEESKWRGCMCKMENLVRDAYKKQIEHRIEEFRGEVGNPAIKWKHHGWSMSMIQKEKDLD